MVQAAGTVLRLEVNASCGICLRRPMRGDFAYWTTAIGYWRFGFQEAAMAEIVHPHDDPFYGELRAFANRDGFVVIEMKEEKDAPFIVLSALEAARLMAAMRKAIAGIDTDVQKALPPED
jgi:hypothetical protein